MDPATARDTVIVPALNQIGLYSPEAERLLMGTAAVESNFVNFVQFGGGPARGMFQMEPPTFDDLLNRFLAEPRQASLAAAVAGLAETTPPSFTELSTNHVFAAAMARVKYFSVPPAIPAALDDQATYWWRWYNGSSPDGIGVAGYLKAWTRYCAGLYPAA